MLRQLPGRDFGATWRSCFCFVLFLLSLRTAELATNAAEAGTLPGGPGMAVVLEAEHSGRAAWAPGAARAEAPTAGSGASWEQLSLPASRAGGTTPLAGAGDIMRVLVPCPRLGAPPHGAHRFHLGGRQEPMAVRTRAGERLRGRSTRDWWPLALVIASVVRTGAMADAPGCVA